MTQDPNSASDGKIFTAALNLPAGLNTVEIVAENLGTTGPGPHGGYTSTRDYDLTVNAVETRSYNYDPNGNCTGYTTADGGISCHQSKPHAQKQMQRIEGDWRGLAAILGPLFEL